MKSVFVLFLIGPVFSEVTQITKREMETVTLKSKHYSKSSLWTYGPLNPIRAISIVTNGVVIPVNSTRFSNRLRTDEETGSITISNLTTNDSGIFLFQFLTETVNQTFNLAVLENEDELKNVLVGKNLTLKTGIEKLEKDHHVKWTPDKCFCGHPVAQWEYNFTTYDERYKDHLLLNPHDGSLTLIAVTLNYTGYYSIKVLDGDDPYILKTFLVTVFEPVSKPHASTAQINTMTHSLKDESCHLECHVHNSPNVTLSWREGEETINNTSSRHVSTNLTLPLEIRDQTEGIYTCVAENPVTKEVITVNSTQWCPSHGSDTNFYIVVPLGVLVLVLAVTGVIYLLCRQRSGEENCLNMSRLPEETPSQTTEEGSNEALDQRGLLTDSEGNLHQDQSG